MSRIGRYLLYWPQSCSARRRCCGPVRRPMRCWAARWAAHWARAWVPSWVARRRDPGGALGGAAGTKITTRRYRRPDVIYVDRPGYRDYGPPPTIATLAGTEGTTSTSTAIITMIERITACKLFIPPGNG